MTKLSKALDIYLTIRGLKQQFLNNCSMDYAYSIPIAFNWKNTPEGHNFWKKEFEHFNKLQIIDLDTLFIPDTRIVCDTYKEVIELFRFLHLLKLTWASGDRYTSKQHLKSIEALYDKNEKSTFYIPEGKRGIYSRSDTQNTNIINYKDIIIPK